jgi:glycosyltransferase involved in cell wall biosynthesis
MSPQNAPIQVVIPVRDEAATIGSVVRQLRHLGLERILVVDNGSSDASADRAREAGAVVVTEPRAGYGQACWRGCLDLDPAVRWILFCDGDGSDDLACLSAFLALRHHHDLLLGDRTATPAGLRALSWPQRFGNGLATRLIALGWGHQYRDLGPLRLIRRSAFEALQMVDRGFGWTIEMQVKALQQQLRVVEVPVPYRSRQGGHSKISGRLGASLKAGRVILCTIAGLYLRRLAEKWRRPRRGRARP